MSALEFKDFLNQARFYVGDGFPDGDPDLLGEGSGQWWPSGWPSGVWWPFGGPG